MLRMEWDGRCDRNNFIFMMITFVAVVSYLNVNSEYYSDTDPIESFHDGHLLEAETYIGIRTIVTY